MSEQPEGSGPPEDASPQESAEEAERRERHERRSLIDLTRVERGEPERRRLPGVERRGPDDDPAAG